MYQRSSTGGLTAEELDGVLSQFEKNRKSALELERLHVSVDAPHAAVRAMQQQSASFHRGTATGYRLAIEYIMAVVGWHCTEGCDQAALFVDTDGKRWCADHAPDYEELTISEHEDGR